MDKANNAHRATWCIASLLPLAKQWCKKRRQQRGIANEHSADWWHFITRAKTQLPDWIDNFIDGEHRFSPQRTYHFPDETVRVWEELDKMMVWLLFKLLQTTFKHLIPKRCVNLQGPSVIKGVTRQIKAALQTKQYQYVLRIDIKSYYASIDRQILCNQLKQCYDDPLTSGYLNAIVHHAIDDRGCVFVPSKGIPLRSSLSPFFGALYLAPLDLAFESMDVFYCRYCDDVVILVKNKRQFAKAKKRLFGVLRDLKLTVSPQKTWLGKLSRFHFLGVQFEVSQNPQTGKDQVSAVMHRRCCSRALDKVKAAEANAVDAATNQRYLIRWAAWWSSVGNWYRLDVLSQWTDYACGHAHDYAWLGSGLVAFEGWLRQRVS